MTGAYDERSAPLIPRLQDWITKSEFRRSSHLVNTLLASPATAASIPANAPTITSMPWFYCISYFHELHAGSGVWV